jgi:hypothetical protein
MFRLKIKLSYCGKQFFALVTNSAKFAVRTEAGVLDEPYSAKPAQRSSHTGPPGYIAWTRFQPM